MKRKDLESNYEDKGEKTTEVQMKDIEIKNIIPAIETSDGAGVKLQRNWNFLY